MNPPAFPRAGHEWDEMEWVPAPAQNGMTLRDYFAAKAMQSHVQREDVFEAIAQDRVTPEKICAGCYAWADAMMKAREA